MFWFLTQGALCFWVSKFHNANQVKKLRLGFEPKQNQKKMRFEFGTKIFHANHRVKESASGVRILHH